MSDVVIASNQSIKTQKKLFQYNTPSAGSFTQDIFSATDSSYIEVDYVKVTGNSSAIYRVIEITSGITLHTVTVTSGGGGATAEMNRLLETTQSFALSGGSGVSHPKSLRIPNGCKLQASIVDAGSRSNSIVAIGIEFINSP